MGKIDINLIKQHPKNSEIYGTEDISELAQNIKDSGYIKPLLLNSDNVIISGHRRYKACLELNIQSVPVETMAFNTEQEELEALLLENMYRDKTVEQKVREAEVWETIEKEKAKERQGTRTDIVENFPPSEMGKTRDIVAKQVGIGSGKTLESAKVVVKKIDELRGTGDTETAEFLSKALDKSVYGAKKLIEGNVATEVPKIYRDMVKTGDISVDYAYDIGKMSADNKKKIEEQDRLYEELVAKEKQEREEKERLAEIEATLPENAFALDKFRRPEQKKIFGITDFNNLTNEQYEKCQKHCKKYEDVIHKVSMLSSELDTLQAWSIIYENQEEMERELRSIEWALENLIKFQRYFKGVKKN